jgi:hypothetical protein
MAATRGGQFQWLSTRAQRLVIGELDISLLTLFKKMQLFSNYKGSESEYQYPMA